MVLVVLSVSLKSVPYTCSLMIRKTELEALENVRHKEDHDSVRQDQSLEEVVDKMSRVELERSFIHQEELLFFQKVWISIPSIKSGGLQPTTCDSSSSGPNSLFWPMRDPGMHVVYIFAIKHLNT